MKKSILTLILLFNCLLITAQSEMKKLPISISYFGNYLIRPGLKVGTELIIKQWPKQSSSEENESSQLLVRPQLAVYSWPTVHTSFLANADLAYRWNTKGSAVFVGLGYVRESQIESLSVNLGNGDISNKNRKGQGCFLPTVGYEFGRPLSARTAWFSKVAIGIKLAPEVESSMEGFFELGVSYRLGTNTTSK